MSFVKGNPYEGSVYVRHASAAAPVAAAAAAAAGVRLVLSAMVGNATAARFAIEPQHFTTSTDDGASGGWQRIEFSLTPSISSSCSVGQPSPNHTGTCNGLNTLTGCSDGCVSSPELGQRCESCNGALSIAVESVEPTARARAQPRQTPHGPPSSNPSVPSPLLGLDVDQVTLQPGEWGRFNGLNVRDRPSLFRWEAVLAREI
jgi:hypothetical protein